MQLAHTGVVSQDLRILSPEKWPWWRTLSSSCERVKNDLIGWVGRLSAQSFTKVWDNPEDMSYDNL